MKEEAEAATTNPATEDNKTFRLTRRADGLFPPQTPAELEAQSLAHAIVDFKIDIAELRDENAELRSEVDRLQKLTSELIQEIEQFGYGPPVRQRVLSIWLRNKRSGYLRGRNHE